MFNCYRNRLKTDIKKWGADPTPRQALECAAKRKAAAARLMAHRDTALKYVPLHLVEASAQTPLENQGKPEKLGLSLPSSLAQTALRSKGYTRVKECERQLRRVSCLKALQTVRAVSIQKAHILRGRPQKKRGVIAITRSEGVLARLADRVTHARWLYTQSRAQLMRLGLTEQDRRTFRPLEDSDMKELSATLHGKDALGDGYTRLPWYWRVELSSDGGDSEQITSTGAEVQSEYEEST